LKPRPPVIRRRGGRGDYGTDARARPDGATGFGGLSAGAGPPAYGEGNALRMISSSSRHQSRPPFYPVA